MSELGKLFVFEGPDGVGKTTLSRGFAEHLSALGVQCEHMSFPGHRQGSLGSVVYKLHHEPSAFGLDGLAPTSLQLLHIAAHIDAIERQIMPALHAGRHVVLDRFWWSTFVYGVVSGISRSTLLQMIELELGAWQGVKPDRLFLIRRERPLRNEPSSWPVLMEEYVRLAARENGSYPVLEIRNESSVADAMRSIEEATASKQGPAASIGDLASIEPKQGTLDLRSTAPASPTPDPTVFSKWAPAKPTIVFDTYWRFACMRQEIFHKRVAGELPPWTKDAILREHKFTNAYRASDRVSQYLISKVIYSGDWTPRDLFFRIMLFKLFNKVETWELLERSFGEIVFSEYSFKAYDAVLTRAINAGERIYSAAYIMPTGRGDLSYDRKHRTHLKLLERMMGDDLPQSIAESGSMRRAFDLLRSYPTIGDFLAYQFITDINYSTMTDFSEMEFVVPGPGARDGIRKCFSDTGGLSEPDLIRAVTDRQDEEFAQRGLSFQTLWGRPLQLIDCQNLFCEVDKYARLRHPEFSGKAMRTRIKQKYSYSGKPLVVWYPPKWGINNR
jgi:thymidylate kinase